MSAIGSVSSHHSSMLPKQEDRDPDLLPCEEIAESMVTSIRNDWKSEAIPGLDLPSEEYWNNKRTEFIQRESVFRKNKATIAAFDNYEPAGGLSYSMNYAEIAAHVQKKFDDLRASGILFSRAEFESKENPTLFRTLGVLYSPDKKSGALDRLWGAEYLRKHLNPEGLYRVPRFIVVIENHVRTLPIEVYAGGNALFLSSFDTSYGEILAEKIDGPAVCSSWDAMTQLKELGYVDYSDQGNIRLGKDGKRYIVDTEWKSLEGVIESSKYGAYRNYIKDRFQTFHPWLRKTFHVEINLEPNLFPNLSRELSETHET